MDDENKLLMVAGGHGHHGVHAHGHVGAVFLHQRGIVIIQGKQCWT